MSLEDQALHLSKTLTGGFELRGMTFDEFKPLWNDAYPKVFQKGTIFHVLDAWSEAEKAKTDALARHMGAPLTFRFGIFKGPRFAGWHVGHQKSGEEFYMRNSGILPEFQGQGLYTSMLPPLVDFLKEAGFQVISSKHNATNNRVIIPKLRAGFLITGMEISDRFGTMVRLEYFTNPLRREAVDVRSGQADLSDRLRPLFR